MCARACVGCVQCCNSVDLRAVLQASAHMRVYSLCAGKSLKLPPSENLMSWVKQPNPGVLLSCMT